MNFLAHYLLATEYLSPAEPRSAYTVGVALPDLLPQAAARVRRSSLVLAPENTAQDRAILAGVRAHLETDAAFHKTGAFGAAQTAVSGLITGAGFSGIRVRSFFLSHILAELALDAVLLRRDFSLPNCFYSAFDAAEILAAVRWTETTLGQTLPRLPLVLARFAGSRYLLSYAGDFGIAEGINHLCRQARQETFDGVNEQRLVELVTAAVRAIAPSVDELLTETAHAVQAAYAPTTEK